MVKEGAYWTAPDKSRIKYEPLRTIKNRRPTPPEYHGLTLEEAAVYDRLRNEAMVLLNNVREALGMQSSGTLHNWLSAMKVPIFLIGHHYKVFSGDIVRAVEACRIPTEGTDGLAWTGYFKASAAQADRCRQYGRNRGQTHPAKRAEGRAGSSEKHDGTAASGVEGASPDGRNGRVRRGRKASSRVAGAALD